MRGVYGMILGGSVDEGSERVEKDSTAVFNGYVPRHKEVWMTSQLGNIVRPTHPDDVDNMLLRCLLGVGM